MHKEIMDFGSLGPPHFLAVDQGTAYISKDTKSFMTEAGNTLDKATIEKPSSIGIAER